MKILFIDTSLATGGAETYLLNLSQFLEDRHQLYFIISPENYLVPEFKKIGQVGFLKTGDSAEKWCGLNLVNPRNRHYQSKIREAATSFKKDFDLIFFAGYLKDVLLFNNLFAGTKLFIFHTPPPNWLSKFPFRNIFIKASKNLDKIIAISDFNAKWLFNIISKEKIVTIKNGIDINTFSPIKESEKENIKAQIPLPLDNLIIGNTSRIHKAKGQIKLVRIFKNLKKKYPNLSLLFVNGGSRSAEKALKKEIISLGLRQDVFWFNFQKDINKVYQAMDIFALPSTSENLPLTVIEAMASGLPVVAFDTAGVSEEIDDGDNGFLIKCNDESILQEKIEKLIQEEGLRRQFGQKARQKAEKEFNQYRTFAKIEELLKKIVMV